MQAPAVQQPGTFERGDGLYWSDGKDGVLLLRAGEIELRGVHNRMNVLAAAAIACSAGLPAGAVAEGVAGFRGVEHRLELVRHWGGASWYNDSIATAPERTIAAMRSFTEPLVLLVGGRDKNLPWDEFAALARQRVRYLVIFGEAAETIEQALRVEKEAAGQDWPYRLSRCRGLRQAVQEAAHNVQPGDIVLLSPGGTSFDEFRDFSERGEVYRTWVKQLM
jgi:UDP-N-acetylmuramoylalanine--D-glutamate ligase